MEKTKIKPKYIFVTGGVLSGVGKGITAASMGAILKDKGMKVSIQKCDPYLNVDAGMLNPLEHGECFVTKDGAETDLDLGHYERFLDTELTRAATTLSGSIYLELIEKERAGEFEGKTVQMVPHFTRMVQERILKAGRDSEVHIVEIGGTVGDYESLAFIEAIRLFANRVGRENCLYVSVVYAPFLQTSKELKTKPAQNALRELLGFGIVPDVVCLRSEELASRAICEKIANFAGIEKEAVVSLPDIDSVYDVPLNILKSGVVEILEKFVGNEVKPGMKKWKEFSRKRKEVREKGVTKRVGIVTNYPGNEDVGLSVVEALKAAAIWEGVRLSIEWMGPEDLGKIENLDGVVELEGFLKLGENTVAEGALEKGVSYLGLGRDEGEKWLGEKRIRFAENSKLAKIYQREEVVERVRFRYQPKEEELEKARNLDLVISGKSGGNLMAVEGRGSGFFIMMQMRPEFRSRPMRVHELFKSFMRSLKK